MTSTISLLKRITSGSVAKIVGAFITRGLGAVVGVIMTALITRYLALDAAGAFLYALSLITIISAFSGLGLSHTLLRYIGAGAAESDWLTVNSAYGFAMKYAGIAAIFAAVSLWFISGTLAALLQMPDIAPILRALSPSIVAVTLYTIHAQALQALHETIRSILVLNILAPLLLSLALVATGETTPIWVSYAYTASTTMTLIVALWLWWRHSWVAITAESSQPLWHSCLPLWVVVIAGQLTMWGGQIIAGFFVSADELAFLAVSQRLAIIVSFVLIVVNLVYAPRFAALWKQQKLAELKRNARLSNRLIALLAIPTVSFAFVFAEYILNLFGPEYRQASSLFRILLAGQLINALTGSVGQLMMMSGNEKDVRNVTVASGTLGLLLIFILALYFGSIGAAAGTAMTLSFQNIALYVLVRRRLGFHVLNIRFKP